MSSQEGPKKTLHVNLRVRALDDVQSPDPGALCFRKGEVALVSEIEAVGKAYGTYFNKKGWFALDQVVIEPGTSPRMSPRSGSLISPRSAGSGNSSPSMRGSNSPRSGSAVSSPSGERFPTPSSPSSGGSSPVGSPVPTRNQNRPTAKKLSSFLWKTRDERTTEVTGSPSEYPLLPSKPPPSNLSPGVPFTRNYVCV
jgi:hypothetical protein